MQDYIPRKIDINGELEAVVVQQYDNLSRYLHVQIVDKDLPDGDENAPFDMTGCEARMYVEIPDAEPLYFDGEIADGEGGVVTFLIPNAVTQNVGEYHCVIRISNLEETSVISTKPFLLRVEESIYDEDVLTAMPEYSALENALFQVALNKARIDNLVASSSNGGVVSGMANAELIDIRESYDGTIYATAGNAVRAQIEDVYENLRAATAAEIAAAMDEDYSENDEINDVVNDLQTVLLQSQNFLHQIASLRRQLENVAALIPDGSVSSEKLSAALQRPENVISAGTVAEMLWCAETYFGKAYTADGNPSHILYETGNGLYSESLGDNAANGQYGIVCSSFVDAILNGVTFNNSRYNGNANNTGQAWGVKFDDTIPFGRTENPSATEIANRYLTSQALAKYAAAHGYLYRIDGMQNIRAGDVVFSGDISDRYLGIDHVAIVVNASPTHLSVIEAVDDVVKADGSPVGLRINKRTLSYFTYGATFPMGSVENHVTPLETATGTQISTRISDGYTTLHTFAESADRGFYTVVCHGKFPAAPYITVTYDGSNSGTGQGSMHRVGNDCYLTFYSQKAGVVSVVVANDGNTYTPSEMTLYRGYADITSSASLGTELTSDSDLDDCRIGIYYCRNALTAQRISNTPLGGSAYSGFRLEAVQMSGKERYMQTLTYIGQPEKVYVRQYTATGWTGWFVYSGTAVPGAETPPEAETPPAAPASITATAGSGSIAVTWAESSGAAYYTLERKAGSGAWSAIAQNYTGRSYTDNSVTAGTSYQYRVTAHKTGTSGVLSSSPTTSSTVTAAGTPSGNITLDAPASVTATAGSGQISVTWGAVSGASRYQLERSADNGATWTTLLLYQTDTGYTDSTVTAGTTYKYRVTAYSSTGGASNGVVSSSVTAQAAPTVVIGGNAITSPETATQVVSNITVGWNLGNTLDCCNDPVQLRTGQANRAFGAGIRSIGSENEGKAYETSWGDTPITTQEMLEAVANAGFNAIRIPVTWNHHLRDAALPYDWGVDVIDSGRYTTDIPLYPNLSGTVIISPFFLKRVKEVVNMALNAGFQYVILDTHHDTADFNSASSRTLYYAKNVTGLPWLTDIPYQLFHCSNRLGPRLENVSGMTDEKDFQNMCDYMYQLWTMIATEFKDYDYRLIFEGFNEMLNWARAWDQTYHAGNNNEVTTTQHQRFNAFNNTFIKAVRNAGGAYNPTRVLSCETFGATTTDFIVNGFSLSNVPDSFKSTNYCLTDNEISAENSRIILQAHYYNDVPNNFQAAAESVASAGLPVIFGEVGWNVNSGAPSDLYNFGYNLVQKAKSAGAKVFWWDNNKTGTGKDCYGVLNRWNTKNGIVAWHKEALKDGLIAGANAT